MENNFIKKILKEIKYTLNFYRYTVIVLRGQSVIQ